MPVRLASSREASPRAMNSARTRRRSMVSLTQASMKLDSDSPSASTLSAASRSSGSTRSEGRVAVFMVQVRVRCSCDAFYFASGLFMRTILRGAGAASSVNVAASASSGVGAFGAFAVCGSPPLIAFEYGDSSCTSCP